MVDLGDSFRACCRALGRVLVSACGWLAGVGISMASFQIYWMSGWIMYGIYHAMCSLICGMICWIGIALFHRYLSLPACTCIVWDVTLIWQCGCHTHWLSACPSPCLPVCLPIYWGGNKHFPEWDIQIPIMWYHNASENPNFEQKTIASALYLFQRLCPKVAATPKVQWLAT